MKVLRKRLHNARVEAALHQREFAAAEAKLKTANDNSETADIQSTQDDVDAEQLDNHEAKAEVTALVQVHGTLPWASIESDCVVRRWQCLFELTDSANAPALVNLTCREIESNDDSLRLWTDHRQLVISDPYADRLICYQFPVDCDRHRPHRLNSQIWNLAIDDQRMIPKVAEHEVGSQRSEIQPTAVEHGDHLD